MRLPDILAALSESDPAAAFEYEQVLWGFKDELGTLLPDGGFDSIDLSVEALGCYNYSAIEVTGGSEVLKAEYAIAGIQTEIHERVIADQRLIDAAADVKKCVDESDVGRTEIQFEEAFSKLEAEAFDLDPADIDRRFDEVRRMEVAIKEFERGCELSSGLESLYNDLAEEAYRALPQDRISELRPLVERTAD